MDKINGISSIVSLLKTQVSKSQKKDSASSSAGKAKSGASNKKGDIKELDRMIAERIRRLGEDTPQRRAKAVRLIIESILAWEFGDQILMDTELVGLLDKLADHVESSEELKGIYNSYITGIR